MLKENISQIRTLEEEAERDLEEARKAAAASIEVAVEKSEQIVAAKVKTAEDEVARLILQAEVKGNEKTEHILSEADQKKGILRDDSRSKVEEAITLVKDTVINGN